MKYAFIMNSGTLDPETYSKLYEDRSNRYYFAATHGMEMTRELAKQLADDNYDFIDLCGDFDEEKAADIKKAADGKVQVNFAKYSKEQLEKFNALPSLERYGIIVLGFDMKGDTARLTLESSEYNTYVSIVPDEEAAAREAGKMAEEGICFIELCGYFTAPKAEKILEAIDYKVPIGYCGN
jgi:RecA/RadA recombinase